MKKQLQCLVSVLLVLCGGLLWFASNSAHGADGTPAAAIRSSMDR